MFPPPLATHIKIPPPPLATHALRPYLTTFLLSNFPPLGNPCFQWFKFKYNIPFIKFFPPPLGNPCFATLPDNIPFIKNSSPPWANHALRPYLTTFLFIKFSPLGNPCFQWFKFKYNIHFIKFFLLPLATHALRPYLTTFLLSNSPPPWQPMLSMIQVQVQQSFYQIFPPPLGNPCFATLPDNIPFIKFPPPLGNPCFQWFKFKYNIPFIKFFPPLGNPCFATLPDNIPFIKFSTPPLATHVFNDSSSSTTFLLSNFPPPLGNPCFATLPDNIPFIKFSPPPLATHAFNDSSSSTTFLLFFPLPLATRALRPYLTTFLLSNFSPPWQPMLSMIQVQVQHSFYQIFPHPLGNPCFATLPDNIPFYQILPPLGNPCFQWFKFKYNIHFIKFFLPPPWQPMLCDPTWQHSFYQISPPPWQPMLSMIQVQVQHSFYQILPPLGNPCFATLPDNIPFIKFSTPPLATHAFNDSSSSTTFLLSNFSPPRLTTHALRPYLTTFLLSKISPPLGKPCFATLPDNIPFFKFSPPWQPMLSMIQVQVQHSFYQISPPPWQPMLCDPTWQHSFYQIFPPLGNPCFQWFKFKYNIPFIKFFPPPPWQPMLSMIQAKHSIQTRKRATEICSQRTARNFSTPRKTPVLLCSDPTQLLFPINNFDHR